MRPSLVLAPSLPRTPSTLLRTRAVLMEMKEFNGLYYGNYIVIIIVTIEIAAVIIFHAKNMHFVLGK